MLVIMYTCAPHSIEASCAGLNIMWKGPLALRLPALILRGRPGDVLPLVFHRPAWLFDRGSDQFGPFARKL